MGCPARFHWYASAVPAGQPPATAVRGDPTFGLPSMVGSAVGRSVPAPMVTGWLVAVASARPRAETVTETVRAAPWSAATSWYDEPVAPGIGAPLRSHW